MVGTDGVVGIKSGLTTEAGGCDLLALDAKVGGHPVQIISAVLGQRGPDRLAASGRLAFNLASSREAEFVTVILSTPARAVGLIGWKGHLTTLHVSSAAVVPAWPGSAVRSRVILRKSFTSTIAAGTTVGWLVATAGPVTIRTPVVTTSTVHPPTLLERLT